MVLSLVGVIPFTLVGVAILWGPGKDSGSESSPQTRSALILRFVSQRPTSTVFWLVQSEGFIQTMGVPGAAHVRLFSPRPTEATVTSSTVPAYVVTAQSVTVMMATGEDLFIVSKRIAEPLGIRDGDDIRVELVGTGETVTLKHVKVKDGLQSDVLIHDLFSQDIATSCKSSGSGDVVTLRSGKEWELPLQEMWAGMRVVKTSGTATLSFDGASRNNPKGPAGYGFRILRDNGEELVRGYGYAGKGVTNNEAEYLGLREGLAWANCLGLQNLIVQGDSELVIRQMNGVYQVRENRLQALNTQCQSLLQKDSTRVNEFRHVPREENGISDCLANLGIDTQTIVVACNWVNTNRLMQGQ